MSAQWSEKFSPAERLASKDMDLVSNSVQWVFYSASGLISIFLFLLAANRQRQGDTFGAAMSLIGAVVIALAPTLAKNFNF